MTPVYLRLSDLSPRAREDVVRIAAEWMGSSPWDDPLVGWLVSIDHTYRTVIPLHLGAGADLGVRVLHAWNPARRIQNGVSDDWMRNNPAQLLAALLAAAPKE